MNGEVAISVSYEGIYRGTGKRAVDIIGAGVGIFFAIPFFVIIPILIKLISKGPVFYKQERTGKDGKSFILYKFRSMRDGAEKETGPVWVTPDDKRVTSLGRFLRKTGLDELPQFFNVLKGEMSIVGPRPERPFFIEKYSCLQGRRLGVKPGLFCLAEAENGTSDHNHSFACNPEEKVKYDIRYIDNYSFWLDMKVIALVGLKLLFQRYNFS